MKRGDIILADLRDRGALRNEVAKFRPVAIVQADRLGPEVLETVIVLPLTTKRYDEIQYLRIPVPARGSLEHDSWLIPEQIQSIDRRRLSPTPAAELSHEELAAKQHILRLVLQIP